MRTKIFISAYACEPGLGSEIGVGWHWVLEMSKYFDLWVLTRKSNRANIERWIAEHPEFAQIRFLYFDLPKWARFWKKGLRGVRTYYNIWQACTDRIVKRTMQDNDIRIFHHLTYGNALWRVSAYGQRQFFIWGPVGGMETIPQEFSRHYDLKSRAIEALRRIVVKSARRNRGFIDRCGNADIILCKTADTLNAIPAGSRSKAVLFTDVAVELRETQGAAEAPSYLVNYLAVGRLDAWRGFDLAIEAVGKARASDPRITLDILGEGADRARISALIERKNLSGAIRLCGNVDSSEYLSKLAACRAVVNPALKEGAVTVAFDSMAFGKPLIAVDTGGYTRYFEEEYSTVIPRRSRREIVDGLAQAMIEYADHGVAQRKGALARERGVSLGWDKKGAEIDALITQRYVTADR